MDWAGFRHLVDRRRRGVGSQDVLLRQNESKYCTGMNVLGLFTNHFLRRAILQESIHFTGTAQSLGHNNAQMKHDFEKGPKAENRDEVYAKEEPRDDFQEC